MPNNLHLKDNLEVNLIQSLLRQITQ